MARRATLGAAGARRGSGESLDPDAIFRRGSRTYYNSSKLFPRELRDKVTDLYAFVRTADDYVDSTPQDAAGFAEFRSRWNEAAAAVYGRGFADRLGARGPDTPAGSGAAAGPDAIAGSGAAAAPTSPRGEPAGGSLASRPTGDPIVDRFAALAFEARFERPWVEAFLDAMEADLSVRSYDSLDATLGYVYGSAEAIGLFMAKLMGLPPESYAAARSLGRAMQYVNFVRDFAEDRRHGRRYLPLGGADPAIADEGGAKADPEAFSAFLRRHVDLYRAWAAEGRAGFGFIPARYRIPIATAMDMYDWTAAKVYERPMIVWERQVKPAKPRIAAAALLNALTGGRR